jgi:hypothetical protein
MTSGMTSMTPGSVRGPLIRQWSRRWSIWRLSAVISRSRGSRRSQVGSLAQRNRLRSRSPQVFFAASVWSGGRLHLRGGPLDSTNRADSQRTAHTGCRTASRARRRLATPARRGQPLPLGGDPRVGASPDAREPALGLAADRRRSEWPWRHPSPRPPSLGLDSAPTPPPRCNGRGHDRGLRDRRGAG